MPKDKKAPHLALGLDIGSVSFKAVLWDIASQTVLFQKYQRHQGRPFQVSLEVLTEIESLFSCPTPQITGPGASELASLLGATTLGEIMALSLAAQKFYPQASSLIDIGGEDTKLLWFKGEGVEDTLADFAMNTMCAAGTGSFLDQQAYRLGYSIEEFSTLALESKVPPRVAGRCSVFAKSDMIHLQQGATPDYEIIYGLCLAMARSIKSGLAKGHNLPAPVLFTGGVAAGQGLKKALTEIMHLSPDELIVPQEHFIFGALGAALAGADNEEFKPLNLAPLREFLKVGHQDLKALPPLKKAVNEAHTSEFDWSSITEPLDVYLGVDVGSVSTNVVLAAADGRLLWRQYLPTAGRPLEAISQAFAQIPPEIYQKVTVKGVGTTGSGRYLTADFIGADLTVNEITAQATAAVAFDPTVDTIFEIGGQDSKYISLADGVIVDFTMNKACAAGTGSFLEEQAEKLGIEIKGEFEKLALSSLSPVSLGERCTVFMESDLVHHQQAGVKAPELCAGLCYGIVNNYLGRVVETRKIGGNIFFQGGTSFNQGVAAAFEAVLGKKITVPDNADVTGALGAALIARDRQTWTNSKFVGFDLSSRSYDIQSFECRDCANRCEIRKVSVAGGSPFFYGSRCEKFDERAEKKESKWPDLFAWRSEAAFNPPEAQVHLQERGLANGRSKIKGRMGMIRSMFFADLAPFWATFWASLGYEPVWSDPTNKTTIRTGCEKTISEFCFPIKTAHGHLLNLQEKKLDYIFLPSIINLPKTTAEEDKELRDTVACPYIQSLAYTAPAALGLSAPFLLTGPVYLGEGDKVALKYLLDIGRKIGLAARDIKNAVREAFAALGNFQQRLQAKGREMLAQLSPDDSALVLVGRAYNSFDPGLNLRLNEKINQLGLLALPMDFLPLSTEGPEAGSHYWRYGQKITSAAQLIRNDKRLEALYISNFSCGPDSFILHFFKHQLGDKPFLEIEIDEHSSDVGAVTRLEAFLDSLAAQKGRNKRRAAERFIKPLHVVEAPQSDKTLYLPPMSDHSKCMAAAFRSFGIKAEALPSSDSETVVLGRNHTSGKECYPMVLTLGDFVKLTQRPEFDPEKSAIFMPTANGPCRFGQYGRYINMVMQRLGFSDLHIASMNQSGSLVKNFDAVDTRRYARGNLFVALFSSFITCDLLQRALLRTRPYEWSHGIADMAYQASLLDLIAALENGRPLGPVMKTSRGRFSTALDHKKIAEPRPLVGLAGEFYIRNNDFANENVIRRLEALGLEVNTSTNTEWVSYVNFVNTMRAQRKGLWFSFFKLRTAEKMAKNLADKLAKYWQGFLPGRAAEPPIRELINLGEKFVHRSFQGESILILAKGMELYHGGATGLVNVAPFSCMPGQVVEGLSAVFRKETGGFPLLNLYFDGQGQTNTQARLEAFAYQVKKFQAKQQRAVRH